MLRFGYFDSDIIGVDDEGMPIFDRAELSDLFALLLASLVSDGVLALPNTCFKIVAAGSGLDIERMPGFGMVRGHFCYDDEPDTMTLEEPQKYSRVDRVVMRLNLLERMVEIVIKQGTEAARPHPPELVRPSAGDYFELCLAEITLTPKQTVITQSSIKDTRANSSLCGFITQLIDHLDTDVFFGQLDAFYQEFVDKSNTSYEQFRQMAQEAFRSFSDDITGYMDRLKKDSMDAYERYNADIASYISRLTEKGNADLADITQQMLDFRNRNEAEFTEWFERIRGLLDTDAAGELLNVTDRLAARIDDTEEMLLSGRVAAKIYTEDGNYITDDTGTPVLGDWPICRCRN